MEKLKVAFEVEKRIDRILANRKEELQRLDEQIAVEDELIAAANKAMEKATNEGNLADYQRAKADRRNAMDGKEMHENRKEALNERPLISETEYKAAVAEICAEVAAIDDETKQKLTALSDQMNSAAMVLRDSINKANDVLQRLQHDIYRDADRSRNPKTGEVLPIIYESIHVNSEFNNTVEWGRSGVKNGTYNNYTGRKGL